MDLIAHVHLPDVGNIQLWIPAKADHLMPGQVLSGCVTFSPTKAVFIRGVWVKFAGFNTVCPADSPDDNFQRVDLLTSDEDHFLGGMHEVLLGLGEEDETDRSTFSDGALLQLDEEKHIWNFSFKIPLSAPLSYCDKNVEVLYTATACVDIPGIPLVLSQITHNVIIGYCTSKEALSSARSFGTSGVANTSSVFGTFQQEVVSIMPRPVLSRLLRSVMSIAELQTTCLKVQFPTDRPIYNFEFLSTSFIARCILDTDRVRYPLRILARVLCCVNTRRDPSKPFQNIEKLLENVDAKTASSFKNNTRFGRKNETDGGSYGTIWASSVTLSSPKSQNVVDFEVPVTIDPSLRASSLAEWPRPVPLPLESDCILNFTTSGPLFEYKIILVVTIHKGDQPTSLFAPCISEILVRPPSRPKDPTREAEARPNLTIDTAVGPPHSPPERRGRTFSTPRTPLGRTRSTHLFSESRGSSSATATAAALYASSPLALQRQSRIAGAPTNDENAPPIVRSMKRSNGRQTKEIKIRMNHKCSLPQATKSVPKVMGEAMSRGPAAVLQDRTNYPNREVEITPSRFAPAFEVGTGAVVMCDTFSSSSSSPVTLTPRLRRGSAHSDYSPAMAFVCSASTALLTVGGDCLSPVRTPGPAPPAGPRLNRSELGNGRRDSHTRRLLFSSLVDLDLDDAENENRPIVSAYNHSPLPLVMASRPHSRSTTTSRPLVLPV